MTQAITHNQPEPPTIKGLLARPEIQEKLAKVAGKAFDGPRLMQAALLAISRNTDLQRCSPMSLLDCIMVAAQYRWTIGGPRPGMYIVPYKTTATAIPSYFGLMQTARESAGIEIEAEVVYAGDEFSYRKGLVPELDHVPGGNIDAGEITHAYAIARFKDGRVKFEVMPKAAVDKIRARSRASGNGPWVSDYAEMAKKTVVRRLTKYLPATPEMDAAIELGDRADMIDTTAEEAAQRNEAPMRRMTMRRHPAIQETPGDDATDSFSNSDDGPPPGTVSEPHEAAGTHSPAANAPASDTNPAAASTGAAPVKGRGGRPRAHDTAAAPVSSVGSFAPPPGGFDNSPMKANAGDPAWSKMTPQEIKKLWDGLERHQQEDYWKAASEGDKVLIRASLNAPKIELPPVEDKPDATHEADGAPTDEDLAKEASLMDKAWKLAYVKKAPPAAIEAAKAAAKLKGTIGTFDDGQLSAFVYELKMIELKGQAQ